MSWAPYKVLVIEDDPSAARLVEYALEHTGYQVLTAANGRQALDTYQSAASIDLIVTDLVMPVMGGVELVQELLKTDPHEANYHGSLKAGEFLREIMAHGQTRDWRELIREATGEDLSTRAMMAYFKPLMKYLKKENKGCDCSWD